MTIEFRRRLTDSEGKCDVLDFLFLQLISIDNEKKDNEDMSDQETSDYRSSSSSKSGGSLDSTTPTLSMGNTAVIASVTVVCVILVTVAITILLFCLYRRRKQASNQKKAEGGPPKSSHGSSTMRSDKSDHAYEFPSLPPNLKANQQPSKPGGVQSSDPYVTLEGQSLPHHYQGLGQKSQLPNESDYDELVASTEKTNSDYYFKLEPGSLDNTGLRPGVQPGVRPGVDPTSTDPEDAYDLVEIRNTTGNNANQNQNKDVTNRKDTAEGDDGNPYYFKVEGSKRGSFHTAPVSFRNAKQSHGKRLPSEKGDEANPKPAIAAKPNFTTKTKGSIDESASYDKLDRSALRTPNSEDINANEYNRLLPRLAVQSKKSDPTSSDGYLKVKVGNGTTSVYDEADDYDSLREVDDYNKLDRGAEREFDSQVVSDKNSSSA